MTHVLPFNLLIAMSISDAPRLNLKYGDGKEKKKKQLATKPQNEKDKKSSEFKVEDDILKIEGFEGRIAIKIGGKKYQVKLSHEGYDHKSKDHDKHKRS